MRKKSKNAGKGRNWEDNYDLPRELDFSKLRVVGVGLNALEKYVASKRKTIELEPDVAKDFPTAKAVNEGLRKLREIQKMMQSVKRRKTA